MQIQKKHQAPLEKQAKMRELIERARGDTRVFAAMAFVDRIASSVRLVHEHTRDELRGRRKAAEKERLEARAQDRTFKMKINALQRRMTRMASQVGNHELIVTIMPA